MLLITAHITKFFTEKISSFDVGAILMTNFNVTDKKN